MARAVITPVKVEEFQKVSADVTFVALDGTDGAEVAWDGKDVHSAILVQNSSETTNYDLTIKGGNSEYGIADSAFSIPFGKTKAIAIESGFFKNITGADKGKIVLTGNAALKVAVVYLP